jgi:hypothetical protein
MPTTGSYTGLYEGEVVGEYFADILVEEKVILELKVVEAISDVLRVHSCLFVVDDFRRASARICWATEVMSFGGFSARHCSAAAAAFSASPLSER